VSKKQHKAGTSAGKKSPRQAAEELRRADARRERRRNVLIFGGATVLVVLIIGGAVWGVRSAQDAAVAPIEGVVQVEDQSANHVPDHPIVATELPPTGGDHSPTVQNCGVYDTPVAVENAVHSLEHGAVWLTYRPDLSQEDIAALQDLAQGRSYLLVSPFPEQASPVVATAWGHQLKLDSVDDSRLERFLKRYVNGKQAPEPGAPCTGGIGNPML